MCSSRSRAVARFFVTERGIIASRRHQACSGVWGCEMLFSALVMRYVSEKSTSNMQVTQIKITESKENKSIQILDVSSSTGRGGGGGGRGRSLPSSPPPPPPPPPPPAAFLAPLLVTALRRISYLISLRKILRPDFAFSGTLRLFTVYVVLSYVSVLKRVL